MMAKLMYSEKSSAAVYSSHKSQSMLASGKRL